MNDQSRDAWLSLDEVARRLGVTRLRVREAIAAGVLPARRDNRGFWRVSLGDVGEAGGRMATVQVAPAQLVEILFDEVEEANASLAERTADVERLSALVARQQDLLERTLKLATGPASVESQEVGRRLAALDERTQALLDRAFDELETRNGELAKVTGLLDRAIGAAAGLDAEVVRQGEIAVRQRAMLDRLFTIAEAGLARIAPGRSGGWLSRWRRSRGERG